MNGARWHSPPPVWRSMHPASFSPVNSRSEPGACRRITDHHGQGGADPSLQTIVEPGGTTIVLCDAGIEPPPLELLQAAIPTIRQATKPRRRIMRAPSAHGNA